MLVWCAYCQTLQREDPPFFRYSISHTICADCTKRMKDGDEDLIDEGKTDYFTRLIAAGQRSNLADCRHIRDEGLALGFQPADLAFAAISGVLDEIGNNWQCVTSTVVDEHRATRWCELFLEGMPQPPRIDGKLDLLGTVTPSNIHILGARLAEFVLRDWGIRAEVITPAIPMSELLDIIRDRAPSCVAVSCGIPTAVPEAVTMARELIASDYDGINVLVGPAVRRVDFDLETDRVRTARTLFDVIEILELSRTPAAEAATT